MKDLFICLLIISFAALYAPTAAASQTQPDDIAAAPSDSLSEKSAAADSLSGHNAAMDTLSADGAAPVATAEIKATTDSTDGDNAATEKTLIATPVQHGIYGAPILKSASIGPGGTASMIAEAEVGWILNKKYVIALNVNGLATRVKAPPLPEVDGLILIVNYGGLYLSYIHNSNRLIHYEAGALVGLGQAFYRDNEYRARYNQIDAFVIFEPEVRMMLNVVPGFRLGAALSYRAAQRVDLLGLANKNLSGLSANLIVKLGRF